jgi:hypothetical protein
MGLSGRLEHAVTDNVQPAAARTERAKRPIEILRDRQGGMSKELKERFNEQQRIYKAIRAALKIGPKTVPQLAAECKLDPPKTMWHLMALRRHGEIVEGAEESGYLLYSLKGA